MCLTMHLRVKNFITFFSDIPKGPVKIQDLSFLVILRLATYELDIINQYQQVIEKEEILIYKSCKM